jgi:hypothetical protein
MSKRSQNYKVSGMELPREEFAIVSLRQEYKDLRGRKWLDWS